MSMKKVVIIVSVFAVILIILKCFTFYQTDKPLLIIEVTFMQFACGDEFDDMKVLNVSDPKFSFLIGEDIDPIVDKKEADLKEYFYANRKNQYGLNYRLKGYLDKKRSGCEGASRCFI